LKLLYRNHRSYLDSRKWWPLW